MLLLERSLIKNFKQHNRKETQKNLKALIDFIVSSKGEDEKGLRYLKNYLSWLNGVLYENTFIKPGCKKRILLSKDKFFNEIEEVDGLDEITSLGIQMVNSYIDNLQTRCEMINPIVNNAVIYIDNNLSEDLSLDRVAGILNVSPSYLSSLFTENLKNNFSNFVNIRRIKKAKLLLETTDLSLLEIALESGFNSQSYFCYVFKKVERVTPTHFKRQNSKAAI